MVSGGVSSHGNGVRPAPTGRSLGRLFDKPPPAATDAEVSLLGSLLLEPGMIEETMAVVSSGEQFYDVKHAAVFEAIREVYDSTRAGDVVLVSSALERRGVLGQVGGGEALVRLAESVPSAANAVRYARLVAEAHRVRRLIDGSARALHEAYHADGDSAAIAARLRELADDVQGVAASGAKSLGDAGATVLEQLGQFADGVKTPGFSTGIADVDRSIGSLVPGRLYTVAGDQGMGKSAWLHGAMHAVAAAGHRVLLFTYEMTAEDVFQRMAAAMAGVESEAATFGREPTAAELELLELARRRLAAMPIDVYDGYEYNIDRVRAVVRAAARRERAEGREVGMVAVDFVQDMPPRSNPAQSREQEVAGNVRDLKSIAQNDLVPVVGMAQINREGRNRSNMRPRKTDLRETGQFEISSNVIAFVYRPGYYHEQFGLDLPPGFDDPHEVEFIIAKQRHGALRGCRLTWNGPLASFVGRDSDRRWSIDARGYGEMRGSLAQAMIAERNATPYGSQDTDAGQAAEQTSGGYDPGAPDARDEIKTPGDEVPF